MNLFSIENSLLSNIYQAWNFFALLGCEAMHIYENSNVNGVLTGCLPNKRWVRYMQLDNRNEGMEATDVDVVTDYFKKLYKASTHTQNALPYLELHFNLSCYREYIWDFRVGDKGVSIIFFFEGKYFSLEMSHLRLGNY